MAGNWGLMDKSKTDLGSVTGKHFFTSGDCKCEQVGDDELGWLGVPGHNNGTEEKPWLYKKSPSTPPLLDINFSCIINSPR